MTGERGSVAGKLALVVFAVFVVVFVGWAWQAADDKRPYPPLTTTTPSPTLPPGLVIPPLPPPSP